MEGVDSSKMGEQEQEGAQRTLKADMTQLCLFISSCPWIFVRFCSSPPHHMMWDTSLVIDRTSSQTSNNCLFCTLIIKALPFESEELKFSQTELITGSNCKEGLWECMKSVLFWLAGWRLPFFLSHYTKWPLEGSNYIQDQLQCQNWIYQMFSYLKSFFFCCRIQTQLTCRFWVSVAELLTYWWIKSYLLC